MYPIGQRIFLMSPNNEWQEVKIIEKYSSAFKAIVVDSSKGHEIDTESMIYHSSKLMLNAYGFKHYLIHEKDNITRDIDHCLEMQKFAVEINDRGLWNEMRIRLQHLGYGMTS